MDNVEKEHSKPQFKVTQMISATAASKHFGALRERAKIEPQAILEHNEISAVMLSYSDYEAMYEELESLRSQRLSAIAAPASFFG